MFAKIQRIHFVGIGGIGMSGIAEVLLNLGYKVSGSDLKPSAITHRLAAMGAVTFEGHRAENLAGADVVVTSSAIARDNPEVAAAHASHIPVIPRAEMLAELMRLKYGIAIAGMHGKTTTTSMVAAVLAAGGLDPTVVVGGRVDAMGSNARVGKSRVPGRRSRRERPVVSEALAHSLCGHQHRSRAHGLLSRHGRRRADLRGVPRPRSVLRHGRGLQRQRRSAAPACPLCGAGSSPTARTRGSDFLITDMRCGPAGAGHFALQRISRAATTAGTLGEFHLRVPGEHNVRNATAAIAVGIGLDIPIDKIREGLEKFNGVDRRFQLKGRADGVTVIDDYGHHPTEIRATLAAARQCGFRKIHVIFQPHRYTPHAIAAR